MLARHQKGDVAGPFAQQGGCRPHHLGAVEGGGCPPRLEALLGGRKRLIEVFHFGPGHLADRFLVGRVDDGNGLAGTRRPPGAVDMKQDVWIVSHGKPFTE
ncbi:hypothetical protein D3C71_2027620 [compost metagenome]